MTSLVHSAMGSPITAVAPAKLNLSLAVLARRPDGFHDIESLMVPVALGDRLVVTATPEPGVRLSVRFGPGLAGSGLDRDVPSDASNLVVRAATALAREAGVRGGLAVDLVKEVPSGAGLGGGSSDAAAVLVAAVRVWGIDWPAARLAELAATIGSDVPFFLAAGPAIVRGRGERLERVTGLPALPAVIACPAAGLSTAAVYAACQPDAGHAGDASRVATALATGDLRGAMPYLTNALEPPARRLSAEVDGLLGAMAAAGAVCPRLTGSGSACYTLARSVAEARSIAARLAAARAPGGGRRWPGVFAVRLAVAGRRCGAAA